MQIPRLLLLALSMAFVSVHAQDVCDAPPKCQHQFLNTDFYGNDVGDYLYVKDSSDCCEMCSITPGCVAYSYSKSAAQCFVKFTVGEYKAGTDFISGMIN